MRFYQYIALLFVCLLIVFGGSCNLLEDTGIGEQSPPGRNNPFDPQNDSSELSNLILVGDYTFNEVFTTNEDQLTLSWEADTAGISTSLQFRYKYAGPGEDIIVMEFSEYFTEFELTLSNLRESLGMDQIHYLELEVSSSLNDQLEPKSFLIPFLVDKIQSAGFAFQKAISGVQEASFEIPIWVDELSDISEINGFRLDLIVNTSEVDTESIVVDFYSDAKNPFYWEGGSIFTLSRQIGDTLRIESAIASGASIDDLNRGQVGTISISLLESIITTNIEVSPSSYFQKRDGTKKRLTDLDSINIVRSVN